MAVTIRTVGGATGHKLQRRDKRYPSKTYEVWKDGKFVQGFRLKRDATKYAKKLRSR